MKILQELVNISKSPFISFSGDYLSDQ